MKFEKFKGFIDSINTIYDREVALGESLEKYLCRNNYCIVDITSEITTSLINLLADYYNCTFEDNVTKYDNISWWLYEDVEKVITIKENGKEQKFDVTDIKDFWKFLEDGRNEKIKTGTYVEI